MKLKDSYFTNTSDFRFPPLYATYAIMRDNLNFQVTVAEMGCGN